MSIAKKIESITYERQIEGAVKIDEDEVLIHAYATADVKFKNDEKIYTITLETGVGTDHRGLLRQEFYVNSTDFGGELTHVLLNCLTHKNEEQAEELQELNKLCQHIKSLKDAGELHDEILESCPDFTSDELSIDGYTFNAVWVDERCEKFNSLETSFEIKR